MRHQRGRAFTDIPQRMQHYMGQLLREACLGRVRHRDDCKCYRRLPRAEPSTTGRGARHDSTAPAHSDDYEMLPMSAQPGEYGDDSADVFLLLAFPLALGFARQRFTVSLGFLPSSVAWEHRHTLTRVSERGAPYVS